MNSKLFNNLFIYIRDRFFYDIDCPDCNNCIRTYYMKVWEDEENNKLTYFR